MDIQLIATYIIIGCALFTIIWYIYRQITGKNRRCNCEECPKNEGKCHCRNTQK